MEDTDQLKNTGFISGMNDTDYHVALRGADPEVFAGVDLRLYRSARQWQTGKNGDKMHCVSRDRANNQESWLNWMYQNNKMAEKSRKFLEDNGYIMNGKIELNVRALSQWSGTTFQGNTFPKVCDTAHKKGFGPSNFAAYPDDIDLTWDEYYQDPPKEFEALATEFLTHFDDEYKWVLTGETKHTEQAKQLLIAALRSGTIMVASATCSPWSAKTPPACPLYDSTHSYEVDYIPADKSFIGALDHYTVFDKELPYTYIIPWAMKITVTNIMSDGPKPLIPAAGVGTLLKKNGENSVYMFGLDNNWHGLGNMSVLNVFKGPYDPSKTIRVNELPGNIGFTITEEVTTPVRAEVVRSPNVAMPSPSFLDSLLKSLFNKP